MTQSSPWTEGHDRHAEIDGAPLDAELETAVLRDPLFRDVELGHDLDARDDRLVEFLVDRLHRLVQHAVDPVLDDDFAVPRFDVNVGGAPLQRVEEGRIDQLDDRRLVGGQAIDREGFLARLVVLEDDLDPELLGGLLQDALRRLAFLEDLLDRARRPDDDLDRRAQEQLELVDHEDVGGIGHDDLQAGRGPAARHEVVPEHQIDGDRPEQLGIDLEVREVDVIDADPLSEPPSLELLGQDLPAGFRIDRGDLSWLARFGCFGHVRPFA